MASKRGFGSVYQQKKRGPDGKMVALPTWWIKYSKGGQIFRESSGSYDQPEAEKLLKHRLGEVVTGKFAGLTPERIKIRDLTAGVFRDYEETSGRVAAMSSVALTCTSSRYWATFGRPTSERRTFSGTSPCGDTKKQPTAALTGSSPS